MINSSDSWYDRIHRGLAEVFFIHANIIVYRIPSLDNGLLRNRPVWNCHFNQELRPGLTRNHFSLVPT